MTISVVRITDFPPIPLVSAIPRPPHFGGFENLGPEFEDGLDVTDALDAAIASAPVTQQLSGQSANRYDQATTIVFPSTPLGQPYVVRRPVRLPANKNLRLMAETPRSARLRTLDPGTPILISGGGTPGKPKFRMHTIENLVFHEGGVAIEQEARGGTRFENCAFHGIPGWAIDTTGPGVVNVRVTGCEFSETPGGGVRVGFSDSDNWLIGDGSIFVRMGGVGVELRTPSAHVRNAYFESKLVGAGDHPYIRVGDSLDVVGKERKAAYSGGACRITECRFGGEVGKQLHGPPKYSIVLKTDIGKSIRAVDISNNWFFGWTGGTKVDHPTDSAWAAIDAGKRVHLCTINGNYFKGQQYGSGAVIDNASASPGVNSFVSNAVDTGGEAAATRADVLKNADIATDGWAVLP